MMRIPCRRGALLLVVVLGACGSDGSGSEVDAGPGQASCEPACIEPEVCRYQQCVPAPASCDEPADCAGDTYCDTSAGECLPWGVGPGGDRDDTCTRAVVAGVFFPDAQCSWLGPPDGDPYPGHVNVLGTPVVVDFRAYGDPELSSPSIVFISYNHVDGSDESCIGENPEYTGVIRIIDGRSCEQQASIAAPLPVPSSSLAVGDLTGDGIAEIVAARVGGGLASWQVQADGSFEKLWETESTFGAGRCNWAGPSIHDLDDDARPEIIHHGAVYDADGNELTSDIGFLDPGRGYIPVVADVDRDGQVELVGGAAYYGWDTATGAWTLEGPLGPGEALTAVADFGTFTADPGADDRAVTDGVAEVVTVVGGEVRVLTLTGRELLSVELPGGGNGGPPTVADFDGDGRVELAAAGGTAYSVFDLDCLGTPAQATCASLRTDGLLWSQPSQDLSSSRTGSSVFDFEGDGIAEVVYGDECYTRVYEGPSGDVLYSRYRTSCTWLENPVIADTDADFGAEIVITSNANCAISCPAVDPIFDGIRCFDDFDCPGSTSCGRDAADDPIGYCRCSGDTDCGGDGFVCLDPEAGPSPAGKVCRAAHPGPSTARGIRVVGDQLGRWVATRPIWNQHAYSVTNVGDLGSIPRTSSWVRNWDDAALNNFRQNAPGEGAGAGLMPDLTARTASFTCGDGEVDVTAEVCNRGTEPVGAGVSVAFAPDAGEPCVATTDRVLWPGTCAEVVCMLPAPTDTQVTVSADAAGAQELTECREDNNQTSIDVVCP